jgi:death-on-curing protein
MMDIRFISLPEVLMIYRDQIEHYGGRYGIRDLELLSSAQHAPESTFGNKYLYETIPRMAATYAFHICGNHALIDGNKRTALATALVFLDINGYEFTCTEDKVYETMMAVASRKMGKEELEDFFEKRSNENSIL